MKRLSTLVLAIIFSTILFAQVPQKMSYQAVIRDASNNLVANHSVGMKISILKGSATGTVVYTETQTPTTNANGLVSIEFGGGTGFISIDWSTGSYFIQTETDPTGGTNYTITGTSQLLSVPYALYAKTSGIPVMTSQEIESISSPSQGLLVFNSTIQRLAVFTGNYWTSVNPFEYYHCVVKIQIGTSVTDIDGNNYSSVIIGNQTWMAQNLRTTKLNDGTAIPNITDSALWQNSTTMAYCNYLNTTSIDSVTLHGHLYNWNAVISGKLCPSGWHVPSKADWLVLSYTLGGDSVYSGNQLKEQGITHWKSPNKGATNLTGFTALGSGYRNGGQFQAKNESCKWWSSTSEYDNIFNQNLYISFGLNNETYAIGHEGNGIGSGTVNINLNNGFSVRCIKD